MLCFKKAIQRMTPAELKLKLIKCSPFLLKTKIETEEHFIFKEDALFLNNMCIGKYKIEECEQKFDITTSIKNGNGHKRFEIQIDYKDKPVMLYLPDIPYGLGSVESHFNSSTDLIPQKRLVDDHKTEL
jgi:hypothetical protein